MTAHEEGPDTSDHRPRGTRRPEQAGSEAPAANGTGTEAAGAVAGTDRSRRRVSAWALGGGTEPDPRFTLANERTFLAWIRTSLAMVAGGIAVEAFTSGLFAPEIRKTVVRAAAPAGAGDRRRLVLPLAQCGTGHAAPGSACRRP